MKIYEATATVVFRIAAQDDTLALTALGRLLKEIESQQHDSYYGYRDPRTIEIGQVPDFAEASPGATEKVN